MSKYDTARPYTASYLFIRKNDKYAFVLRQNTPWMNGFYALPAGKVEIGETFTEAAIREAKEETGIVVNPEDVEQVVVAYRIEAGDDIPWIDMAFEVKKWKGEAHNAEPGSHGELAWFALDKLPKNVIPSLLPLLEAYQNKQSFVEIGWNNT